MIRSAAIISTGDEITTGKIADTNAQWFADRFFSMGLDLECVLVVGDYPDRIRWAWDQALSRADVVVSTGGIGPTSDDLTTETVAAVLGDELRFDEASADHMRALFQRMGREMPENNLKQAWFPESATIIPNPVGTAPGYRATTRRDGRDRHLVILPGVPREMKPMFDDTVVPWLGELREAGQVVLSHTFQTFGMSESALDEAVGAALRDSDLRVSFRASFPKIAVKLVARDTPESAEARIADGVERVRKQLGPVIYGDGEVGMEEMAGRALADRGARLAVAESCSGGLIGHRLTDVAGCSSYFLADYVVYSNEQKIDVLGVSAETLAAHGAVSEETAREMAQGARRRSGADVAVATTGIAGPGGGSDERPVGTVCFGLDSAEGTVSIRHQLWGGRDWIKVLTAQLALDWVRRWALGLPVLESGFRR